MWKYLTLGFLPFHNSYNVSEALVCIVTLETQSSSSDSSSTKNCSHHSPGIPTSASLNLEFETAPKSNTSLDRTSPLCLSSVSPVHHENVFPSAHKKCAKTSQLKSKTFKGPRVVTTKTGRITILLNVSLVPIDAISFHHEENAQRWKYVVQRRLADEVNVLEKH